MTQRKKFKLDREQEVDTIFEFLLKEGALELKGMNSFNEPVYVVTEKCKDVFPEFYRMHRQQINNMAYDLWGKGVIEINFQDNEERITFGPENVKKVEEILDELSLEEIDFLTALGFPILVTRQEED